MDRIYNDGDDGTLDDVVLTAPTLVHIERMDDDHIWMRVDRADAPDLVFTFWSDGPLRWTVEED